MACVGFGGSLVRVGLFKSILGWLRGLVGYYWLADYVSGSWLVCENISTCGGDVLKTEIEPPLASRLPAGGGR